MKFGNGVQGKILRINLSQGNVAIEEPDYKTYRTYMGGDLLGLYYMMRETPVGVDPLSEENLLLFMASPLTGSSISGMGRHSIITKSPLTGGFAASQCGGFWGAELKRAGYDGVIIRGRSENPVYILIEDDRVEIRDAVDIWGSNAVETESRLKKLHSKDHRTALIGTAGENLVNYACVVSELHHFAGRGGIGAVMGSKRLKAVVVRGTRCPFSPSDPAAFKAIAEWFHRGIKNHPAISVHHDLGTSKGVIPMSSGGMLPTRNFQDSSFEGAEGISGQEMKKVLGDSAGTCYACAVACKRRIKADPEHGITGSTGGPEYETIASLGSALGIDDIHAVVKANELCNDYGLDTISTGMTIAWATECFERGLLTSEDTGGVELGWNRPDILVDLIEKIACLDGFGKLLALGSKKAAGFIGRGTEEYAMQVKGQELPGHEPRPKWSVALGYAVSPTGADHLQAAHDPWFTTEGDPDREWGYVDLHDLGPLGLLDPVPAESLSPTKVRMFTYLQHVWGFHDVLDICIFVTAPEFRAIGLDKIPQLLSASTGWNTSLFEVMKVGERWVNLLRCYNLREGFSGRDDTLPKRMFEPIRKGAKAGTKIDPAEFQKALLLYYGMMGWDENGQPRHEKLEELAIGWADQAEPN